MYPSLVFGILLVAICDQVLPEVTHIDVGNDQMGSYTGQRGKRAIPAVVMRIVSAAASRVAKGRQFLRGLAVERTFLKGVEPHAIIRKERYKLLKLYDKHGGLVQMKKDWDAVKPFNTIQKIPGGMIGTVGDRRITMTIMDGKGKIELEPQDKTGEIIRHVIDYVN